jgi:membrane protease YdiL (CAAX protease family)
MSQNSSDTTIQQSAGGEPSDSVRLKPWWVSVIFPVWLFISYYTALLAVFAIVWVLKTLGVQLESLNFAVLNSLMAALVYIITLSIVILVPQLVRKHRTTLKTLGIKRWPLWSDIALAPAGYVIYFLASAILILFVTKLWPTFNVGQDQVTGFNGIVASYQYYLAFITLVVIAPIAEEVLFRGYLFGKLKSYIPIWVAAVVTSMVFGSFHIFGTNPIAWNLAVDTFALSMVLCLLREATGNLWASILLHMIKNGIAFYLLFINPAILSTLVR